MFSFINSAMPMSATDLKVEAMKNKLASFKHIVFHAGIFHADEIYATAYLMLLYDFFGMPFPKWERKNVISDEMSEENGYLIYDIGGGRFDHHFPEDRKERREDGTPFAAFGLIVREFHVGFLNEEEYQQFDNCWIKDIDRNDNTGCGNSASFEIKCMNSTWDAPDANVNIRVANAISKAKDTLSYIIDNVRSEYKAKSVAENAQDIADGCVYLDYYAPIGKYLGPMDGIAFFGFPSNRDIGKYSITSVKYAGVNKMLFPSRYCGLSAKHPDYEKLHDESGMTFCHPNGFMATFDSKKAAKEFFMKHKNEFVIPAPKEDAE